jgi:hypothetical protein
MESMRSTWTDSRLEDLNERVGEISTCLGEQSLRIDALQRTIIQVGGAAVAAVIGLIAAMLGVIATLIATQL